LKHDFLDKHSHLDSPVHRLDPRVKVIAAFSAIVIIVTEPLNGGLFHFVPYSAMVIALISLSRLPVQYLFKRILIVSPFILMAALFYPLSIIVADREYFEANRWFVTEAGATILMKSLLAVLLLILLSSTERFHRLLLAMRKLGIPTIITTISALLYRYIFLLVDETLKTTRARESRAPGRMRMNRLAVYGNQTAVIFLRSWERSQIIYKSMLSRGFIGEFPDMQRLELRAADIVLPVLFIALLLAIRLFL
jgi:cobalt/nickel transport system permease protein